MDRAPARACAGPCGARGLALVGAVLALHLLLLAGGAPMRPPPRPGPAPAAALVVRLLPAAAPTDRAEARSRAAAGTDVRTGPADPAGARMAAPVPTHPTEPADRAFRPLPATRLAPSSAAPAPRTGGDPAPSSEATLPTPAAPLAEGLAADDGTEAPAAVAVTTPPPVYPARPLPSAQWRFRLQSPSGAAVDAVLDWQATGDRYQLRFEAAGPSGRPLVQQVSEGALGDAGLAPERFVDRRRARGARALSIEAGAGRVRFSAVEATVPAWIATQDRLAWLLQLAAVARAAAEAGRPLPEVLLHVVDARGGSALWRFVALGDEPVTTSEGPRSARAWRHDPGTADGLRLEVWLDPAAGHRPLRLRQTVLRTGAVTEWLPAAPRP